MLVARVKERKSCSAWRAELVLGILAKSRRGTLDGVVEPTKIA